MNRTRSIILILLIMASCCIGAELFELLDEFRETMVHYPGRVCVKSPSRTLLDGGGTDAELTQGFQRILLDEGFEARIVNGWVTMDSEQIAAWLPDIESGLHLGMRAIGANRWCVPMTWLECNAQYDSLLRGGQPGNAQWIDVFPGFIGSEMLIASSMGLNDSDIQGILRLLDFETFPAEDGCLYNVAPFCRAVRRGLESLHHAQSAMGGIPRKMLGGRGAIQGYRSRRVQPLCPVEVLEREEDDDNEPAEVVMELRQRGDCLLEYRWGPYGVTDGMVVLKWCCEGSGEIWEDSFPPNGTTVAGTRLKAIVESENGICMGVENVLPGNAIDVQFSILYGNGVLEQVEDSIRAGDYVIYVVSSGSLGGFDEGASMAYGSKEALAWELRRRLDRYGRLAGHCFGEFPKETLRVAKIAWCPRGEMLGGMMTRVTHYEIQAGSCGCAAGSRNLSLAMLLGENAVTVDFLKGRVQGEMESPLELLAQEIDGEGVFLSGRFGDGFGGISCANVPFWLDWLAREGEYDGTWFDADGEAHPAGIVRVRDGWVDEKNLLDFHDEEWLAALNVLRAGAANGVWGIGNEAGELMHASVFAECYRRIMGKCILRELTIEPRIGDGGSGQIVEIVFEAEGVESWQLLIIDEIGQVVFSGSGEGGSAILEWDGAKDSGGTCKAGNCTLLLVMASGREAVAESRVFLWDDVPPEVALHAYSTKQAGLAAIGVEYDVRDDSRVTVQVQLTDPVTRRLLAERTTSEPSGRLLVELPDDPGDVCLVQIIACDERQNVGGASSYVVLGTVYAGGAVWSPYDDDSSSEDGPMDFQAELESPVNEQRVNDGVVAVLGRVTGVDGLKYQLRLRNGQGRLLECLVIASEDEWHLTYVSTNLPEDEVELIYPMRSADEQNLLGRLDLTGLPNGKYTLELVAIAGKQFHFKSVDFYLESTLKTGQVTYAEKDGTLRLDSFELELWRRYSNLSGDSDYGYGWTVTLDAFETELQEERIVRESLTGGRVSLRCGGSRDVTLTLPDGRRTTFVFSLVYAGGYSYTYKGSWKAYDGCPWRLSATVNSDVTALPGLGPYWNATGPGVPLDYYDFPEFSLSGDDGNEYIFGREHLGDYEAAGDDGGEVMLECYGKLYLKEVRFSDGSSLQLADDEWLLRKKGGASRPALKYRRDANGRIIETEFIDGSGRILEYGYSANGNLVSFSTGVRGEMMLKRTYVYDDSSWPHLLTRVLNGAGWTIVTYETDETGRLSAVGNGTGGRTSVARDVFARVEIHTDEVGNESLYRYDERGNVVEQVQPDGGIMRFGYDSAGKMLYREDALGRQTNWSYDDAGRMLSRTNPNGGISYYSYDSSGRCCRMVTPDGRTLERRTSPDNSQSELKLFSGAELFMQNDAQGRLTKMALKGEEVTMDYSADGGEVVFSDGNGLQCSQTTTDDGRSVKCTLRWLDESASRTESMTLEATKDEEGRSLYVSDSFGGWVEYERNVDGKVTLERNSSGHWRKNKYNVQGICVETEDDDGKITRHIYDSAGRLLVTAGPQVFESAIAEPLVFAQASIMEYDPCGRLIASRHMTGTEIELHALNGGFYECRLKDAGVEICHDLWSYDKAGQLVRQELADGQVDVYGYDAAGRVSWQRDARGCLTQFERDSAGNLLCLTDADGGETHWKYDGFGGVCERKDADGRRHEFVRQAGGAVLRHLEDGFAPVVFERTNEGVATKVSQGKLVFILEHDPSGALSAITDAAGRTRRFDYDALGRMVKSVTPTGRTMRWEYDSILGEYARAVGGNVDSVSLEKGADGEWVRQRYCHGDECIHDVEKVSTDCLVAYERGVETLREEWQRDALGRICRHLVGGKVVESYTYDESNRVGVYESPATRVAFQYELGRETAREYTKMGGIELESPLQVFFDYDPTGRPIQEWCSDGWQRVLSYDRVGRVNGVVIWNGKEKVYDGGYEFDEGGRKTRLVEEWHLVNGGDKSVETNWTYDSHGFLTDEKCVTAGKEEPDYLWHGEYDAKGNLVEERRTCGGITEVVKYEYDADDCLTRTTRTGDAGNDETVFHWDESGQLAEETTVGRETIRRSYRWSGIGRLDGVSVENDSDGSRRFVDFQYDTHGWLRGDRVEVTKGGSNTVTEHSFVHEEIMHEDCPQIMDYSVKVERGAARSVSVLRADSPLGLADADGVRHLAYGGHRQLLCMMGGGSIAVERRDAWGLRIDNVEDETGHGAFGEWVEGHSGLVYLRGRFYCPRLRRFISLDPHIGDEEEPKSFNRYAYCMNDPVNRKDPKGTFAIMDFMIGFTQAFMAYQPASYLARSVMADFHAMNYVRDTFSSQQKVNDNAILYVHGMAWHEKGWSEDMQAVMKNAWHVSNQDSYEFLWTGFAASDNVFLPIPNRLNHLIALCSLIDGLAEIRLKGYANVSVVSHSWGTVLSRDALTDMNEPVAIWATMGSPLCCFTPEFPYGTWVNYANLADPVTLAAKILHSLGYMHCEIPLRYQLRNVKQVKIHTYENCHSVYWTSHAVVGDIAKLLKQQ